MIRVRAEAARNISTAVEDRRDSAILRLIFLENII
jgi:hypothetical protein